MDSLLKTYIAQAKKECKYRSDIAENAVEKIVKKYENGRTNCADYFVGNQKIGRRIFTENRNLDWEYGTKNGKYEGNYYYFYESGKIHYQANYQNGKQQGIAAQWNEEGNLIGFSVYDDGTGLELWMGERMDDNEIRHVHLAEERNFLAGERHGFERWWNGDDLEINMEGHFKKNKKHGIFREWETEKLSEEFPKFFVEDKEVSLEKYLLCREKDDFLPAFLEMENVATRSLPEFYIWQQPVRKTAF